MNILAINAGSSSVKFATFVHPNADADSLGSATVDRTSGRIAIKIAHATAPAKSVELTKGESESFTAAVIRFLAETRAWQSSRIHSIDAVGQRVVHGGTRFTQSVRIDDAVKTEIARLSELAPLHNPLALESIDAIERHFPGIPQVAAFDTAYFANLPAAAHVYPLPYEWYRDLGIRRFGFHGLSHSYCAKRAVEMLGRKDDGLRLIICHLGSGCSASAIKDGVPIATTMGFTPLDGIVMGTRPGSIDPGIIPYLQQHKKLSAKQIEDALNHNSGLLGISGVSSDYQEVERAASSGNQRAQLALDIFTNSIQRAVGALAVTLNGINAIVFTAGIGEHAATLRKRVCAGLKCLGVNLSHSKNCAAQPDAEVSDDASRVKILVIATREEAMIAQEAARVSLQ